METLPVLLLPTPESQENFNGFFEALTGRRLPLPTVCVLFKPNSHQFFNSRFLEHRVRSLPSSNSTAADSTNRWASKPKQPGSTAANSNVSGAAAEIFVCRRTAAQRPGPVPWGRLSYEPRIDRLLHSQQLPASMSPGLSLHLADRYAALSGPQQCCLLHYGNGEPPQTSPKYGQNICKILIS